MKKKIEVARSFSRKINLQNYETCDFYCSAKAEVEESEAEKVSEELFAFCLSEVRKSATAYLEERNNAKNGIVSKNLKEPEEEKKLTKEEKADKEEAEMQKVIDDKQEAKYKFAGKDERGNTKFSRAD